VDEIAREEAKATIESYDRNP